MLWECAAHRAPARHARFGGRRQSLPPCLGVSERTAEAAPVRAQLPHVTRRERAHLQPGQPRCAVLRSTAMRADHDAGLPRGLQRAHPVRHTLRQAQGGQSIKQNNDARQLELQQAVRGHHPAPGCGFIGRAPLHRSSMFAHPLYGPDRVRVQQGTLLGHGLAVEETDAVTALQGRHQAARPAGLPRLLEGLVAPARIRGRRATRRGGA